jgi:large subunit ribosomal protein L13
MSYTAGTSYAKVAELKKAWHIVDAEGMVVGRLASEIAKILRGKHKPTYTPHLDSGDNVIVINASKVKFTGKKYSDKVFHWHTGHPGGVKERTMRQILEGSYSKRVLSKAVERMMPKESALARKQMKSLFIYSEAEHKHVAQQPAVLDLASRNPKNKR